MKKFIVLNLTCLVLISLFMSSSKSFAGNGSSLMQTANVLPRGQYEAKIQNDIIFIADGGYNITAHILSGLVDPFLDLEAFVGTGTTDFQIGTMAKINLLPDLPEQMGLALNFGGTYSRDEAVNRLLLSFGVLGSKEFLTNFGTLTPYGAFQFEGLVQRGSDNSKVPLSLLLGAKTKIKDFDFPLYGEIGISLHESNNYIAFGAAYNF